MSENAPTLESSIRLFSAHREEWKIILDFIAETKDGYFAQFGAATDPNRVMSLSGGVGACDYLLQNLTPAPAPPPET